MSLPIAARGAKRHLREAWQGRDFDFDQACRQHGRNDAFWLLCYRRCLDGEGLPDQLEQRELATRANRATGWMNTSGERERYTRHEAAATVDQVAGYLDRALGLKPLLARRVKMGSSQERALVDALQDVARACGRHTFTASYRQLAEMAGIPLTRMVDLARRVEKRRAAWRVGECTPMGGRQRGTTIWSLRPPRPSQRIDEARPPIYDAKRCRWVWKTPSDRGTITRFLFGRAARRAFERSVPNVLNSPSLINQNKLETTRILQ